MRVRALILFSGGMDSTVALAEAIELDRFCRCLFINHGQRNLKPELRAARRVTAHYGVRLVCTKLNLAFLGDLPLLGGGEMEKGRSISSICSEIASTYVPCRNTMFLAMASAYAEARSFDEIWVGFNFNDQSGVPVPDGRQTYLWSMELAVALGSRRGAEDRPILFRAPLLMRSKRQVVRRAQDLGVPVDWTRTCFSAGPDPCGECDACVVRETALSGERRSVKLF